MSDLKDVLECGVQSEFWRWFCARVDEEWGATGKRYLAELDRALNLTDNDAAASQARQIRSGQKAILALLRLPQDELRKCGPSEPDTPDRRPAPEPELAGMSRRGVGL